MSDMCLKVANLSKRFFILEREKTTLRMIKALIKGWTFKHAFWALRDISFEVKKGDKIAVIGKNGSGKTTLLRILAGIYKATSGRIDINEKPIVLFQLWAGFNEELSLIDNIYLSGAVYGMDRKFLKDKVEEILSFSELHELRFSPLKELSLGQAQRLAISIFFQNNSKFLILDESLAFIDQGFLLKADRYFQRLFDSDKTVIIACHNDFILKKYCKKALWLNNGQIQMLSDVSGVIDQYEQ